MKSCDLIIVGGGASGLTATVEYKRNAVVPADSVMYSSM